MDITKETVAAARKRKPIEGHTPGPWKMTTQRTTIGKKINVYVPLPEGEEYTGHNGLCCIYDDGSFLDPRASEEHQANARLIADAPDLQAENATLAELSRQQHEALLVGRQYMESGNKPTSADRQTVDAVLALWPDDPMEEVEG